MSIIAGVVLSKSNARSPVGRRATYCALDSFMIAVHSLLE